MTPFPSQEMLVTLHNIYRRTQYTVYRRCGDKLITQFRIVHALIVLLSIVSLINHPHPAFAGKMPL